MNTKFCLPHASVIQSGSVFARTLRTFGLASLVVCFISHDSLAQDKGLNTPLSTLQNKFADLLSQAEKKIPRSQKYQILNRVRHRLKAGKDKNDPAQLIDLANQYKRYRFYPEAILLFEEVAGNPSNDDEWLMRSNRWLGEIEFVANDDVKAAINYFNKAISYSPKDSIARGYLLGRLGSYYFIDGQNLQMLKTYKRFNQLPERVKAAIPDTHLKANLYSARFTSDPNESAKLFEKARKIAHANPKEFPADLVLSIFSEQNEKQPWNSPDRIKRLVMLVENKDYANEPKIREYAMEIFLAYFLERKKDWKRFEKCAEKTTKLLSTFKSKDAKDTLNYSLASQAIGVHVGAAEQSKQKWDKTASRRDFQKWQSKLKRMSFFFPHNISGDDLREIMKAYRLGASLLSEKKDKNRKSK